MCLRELLWSVSMFFMSEDVTGIGLFCPDGWTQMMKASLSFLWTANCFVFIYFRATAMLCSLADFKLAVLWGLGLQTCANRPYFPLLPLEKNSVQGIESSDFQMVGARQPLCYIDSIYCSVFTFCTGTGKWWLSNCLLFSQLGIQWPYS